MRKMVLAGACAAMVVTQPAYGFGLRAHLYIGEQVINDLETGTRCELTLGRAPDESPIVATVEKGVCEAVLAHRGAFLAGTIGADAFPDPIIGQTYIHPGTEDGRQTADWLERIMRKAVTDEEMAFAFGNMLHAAGDVLAHSYVNNYAGDVYGLFSRWRKDVELRHSLIERYIDQRLPYTPSTGNKYELRVPARLVVRANFQASYLPKNITVDEELVTDLISNPEKTLALLAAEKGMKTVPSWHIRLMRRLILASARERHIGPCIESTAIEHHIKAYRAVVAAEHAARLHSGVSLNPLPAEWKTNSDLPTAPVCEIARSDRRDDERKEQYHVRLMNEREEARAAAVMHVEGLQALLDKSYSAGRLQTNQEIANRRTRWLKSLPWQLRSRVRIADRAYQESGRAMRRAMALARFREKWAGDVWFAVEQYMGAGLDAARSVIRAGDPYPPPLFAQDGATSHYKRWFGCYRPVFLGNPKEMGEAKCARLREMGYDMSLSSAAREAAMGNFLRGPLYLWLGFKEDLDEVTSALMLGIGSELAPTLTGLIKMGSEAQRVSHRQLDRTFRRKGGGRLSFECFSDWIDVDLGIIPPPGGGTGERLDEPCQPRAASASMFLEPEKFIPLKHAVTLSKLALLEWKELERLAGPLAAQMGKPTDVDGPYSVILEMVRSLDGSYQWQGYSMPYPRSHGLEPTVKLLEAGYPYPGTREYWWEQRQATIRLDPDVRKRPGFPFYRTKALREQVLARLFPEPFEGEILRRPEFNGALYPFAPCEGDPFRRAGLGGGGPVRVCATGGDELQPRPRLLDR